MSNKMMIAALMLAVGVSVSAAGERAATKPEEKAKCPVAQNVSGRENIEWSTAYAFNVTDKSWRSLPRVLLVGDSICNGYVGKVRALLEGKVNVTYWISSYCVTRPEYLRLLEFQLDADRYDVVHINNGLHSLGTPTDAWVEGLKAAFDLIRRKQPQAQIVWVTSTPLKDAKLTAKAQALNAAGAKVVAERGRILINDLFSMENPLDRAENWTDTYHHKPALRDREGEMVAQKVLEALKK